MPDPKVYGAGEEASMRSALWAIVLLLPALMAGTAGGDAPVLRIGFGTNKPPYVFEAERRGLEYDIVVGAAHRAGYEVEPVFAPLARLRRMLADHSVDGITITNPQSGDKACYTQPYIDYHNVAIALASRHLRVDGIADLARYSVSSFQRSRDLLGSDYDRMAASNPGYREEANQVTRNLLLFSGRIDVIVGDRRIIGYFNKVVAGQVDVTQPVTTYELFQPIHYSVGFVNPAICTAFDFGLSDLKRSGEYGRIEQTYRDY